MRGTTLEASGHETEDRLELYALGRLSHSDTEQVEEHLLWCGLCRETLDSAAAFALAMRDELKHNPAPIPKKSSQWFGWLTTPRIAMIGAFALILLALSIYVLRPGRPVASLAALQLTAIRGEMQTVRPARQLRLTVTDAPATGAPFRLELVNGGGTPIWSGAPEATPGALRMQVNKPLDPGNYFVRLYASGGELLHEYGFRVQD
ncbi:MAG: zf-HC2 domain-containing protein [Terriglobia bacterium]